MSESNPQHPAWVGGVSDTSQAVRIWQQLKRHTLGLSGGVILLSFCILVVLAPIFAPKNPNYANFRQLKHPPSTEHLLGTDDLGRDVWSRLIYGGRISLAVGFGSVALYLIIGAALGGVSGYFGGVVDLTLQRATDIMMAFPSLLLILTFAAFTEPSVQNVIIAIGLFEWPGVSRIIRAEVMSVREREFILAARSVGATDRRILLRHILPNIVSPLLVTATFGLSTAILIETTMSFLGLGVPLPTPSWGNMISSARSVTVLESMPWLWIPPGVAIAASVLALNFLGDGLRDALDPRTWT